MLVMQNEEEEVMRRTTPISPRSAARWVSKYERSPLLVEGTKPADLVFDAIVIRLDESFLCCCSSCADVL